MKKSLIYTLLFCFTGIITNCTKQMTSTNDHLKAINHQKNTNSVNDYTVTWFGNNFPAVTNYVGNAARSMWVSPEGVVYTASLWDEKGRNIGIYQNGNTIGAMGGTKDSQGSAIGGDSTYIYTAQQAPNSGYIGRYNRNSKTRDLLFKASNGTGEAIRGIVINGNEIFVSDFAGNRIGVYSKTGSLLREWTVTEPGAITIDGQSQLWVTQMSAGQLKSFSTSGVAGPVITMGANAQPSALYCDKAAGLLYVGDQGPDQNIKIYTNLASTPQLQGTFGVTGGYLESTMGIRGQTGDKRFTRIVGIGKDNTGQLYVLNNPWGGSWDLGRNGATDIHCYGASGNLLWELQALNFEGNAAADSGTDGADFYSANIFYTYSGTGGGRYKGNTIDPFRYPSDPRINISDPSRGLHFGQFADVGGKKILIACGQNPDVLYSFYFNRNTDGYIAIPGDSFTKIRNGFALDSLGNVWTSQDKTNAIQYYELTGFGGNGKPTWASPVSTPVPASIARLNRLIYLPNGDRMILAGGNNDWTLIGNRIEVYNGWKAGNRTPNTVITLTRGQAKSMTAAGNYVFVGYYAMPNIDIFDLATGALVLSMTSNNDVYVGNDVDSMYGISAYRKSNGQYLITKDDYNANKVVLYQWTP
ncbi:SMP-30/gluconolaconase/LRE-like region family protein [Mucilaginibacter sp. HC2]|uniref:SMP-30/gluconolaconase/LRE-like region family protein n=1 Tax=Mucilaginibacter inviolabilis TaxID=2714892 RepID=UPI0014087B7F|nr:SMP-30/gluconolaconase/LRE-like region family protein [Mucilaginibacter inviolabilis]NHA03717.1 SMP-30/gluconolaconase/LRE-like region family protein [Mucilaginibacter inviolabilis]